MHCELKVSWIQVSIELNVPFGLYCCCIIGISYGAVSQLYFLYLFGLLVKASMLQISFAYMLHIIDVYLLEFHFHCDMVSLWLAVLWIEVY